MKSPPPPLGMPGCGAWIGCMPGCAVGSAGCVGIEGCAVGIDGCVVGMDGCMPGWSAGCCAVVGAVVGAVVVGAGVLLSLLRVRLRQLYETSTLAIATPRRIHFEFI
jgi:hypothetical protein